VNDCAKQGPPRPLKTCLDGGRQLQTNLWFKTAALAAVVFALSYVGNYVAHVTIPWLEKSYEMADGILMGVAVGTMFYFRNRNLLERTLVNACIHHEVNSGLMCLSMAQTEGERVAAARRISAALDQHCPVRGLKIKTAVEYIRKHGTLPQKAH
jgi:hypothetical protein